MKLFAVFGTNPDDTQRTLMSERLAEHFPDQYMLVGHDQWIIAANTTTQDVSIKLGNDGSIGRLIVVLFDNYYGYHSKAVWEWIGLQGEKE